jgi:hypothetical protein
LTQGLENMHPVRISCEGITVGALEIAPFQLRESEWIYLNIPGPSDAEEYDQLVQVLTGQRPVPHLRLAGRVYHADRPVHQAGWFGWPRRPRPADWLCQSAGVNRAEAEGITARLGLRPEWRIDQLAANPRAMLGLEAAWARGADVVVFSTSGLDPSGLRAVHEAVSARLDRCAALQLSYPFFMDGCERRECLPGVRCMEVTRRPGSPAALTPV